MTKKENEGQPTDPYAQYGEQPAWDQTLPPPPHYQGHPYSGYPHPGYMHPGHAQPSYPHQGHPHHAAHHMPPHGYGYPHGHPHAFPPGYMHTGMMPPSMMGQMPPEMMQAHMAHMQASMMQPQSEEAQSEPNPLFDQAQAMLEGALGEEAGMFKEILGSFGMNDKEFWKGAMVGAAAALILSNENVRKGLMGAISGAGNMLKTGGEAVKDTATQTAASVQQNVSAGNEIFRDTYAAGKEGFKESVERHQQVKTEQAEAPVPAQELDVDNTQNGIEK
ncbi:YtxH domain-containing protein [Photobacterium swingsii]|uniref:YtxH domain-containing protein n=1 Tax=Photobacterium swingsii TaxID=680026 RepID=UPI0040689879